MRNVPLPNPEPDLELPDPIDRPTARAMIRNPRAYELIKRAERLIAEARVCLDEYHSIVNKGLIADSGSHKDDHPAEGWPV